MKLAGRPGAEAAAYAKTIHGHMPPGYCQQFTRQCQDCPSGARTANDSVRAAADLGHLHTGWFPPPGVSVHFDNRRVNGDPGHATVSLGDGVLRSTDWPRSGVVSSVSIGAILRAWFDNDPNNYVGWTESDNGRRTWIPPGVSVDITGARRALHRGVDELKHGHVVKRQLALVLGDDAGMNLHDDHIGPPAIRAAARVEKLWHPKASNGWLSEPDIRRLGSRRNAFTTHR